MPRVAWITDPHLNFMDAEMRRPFYDALRAAQADAVLLSGDITESEDLATTLRELATVAAPLYFVLGNHDYYRSSIRDVRGQVRDIVAHTPGLTYLSECGVQQLAPGVGLVGHDGWGDGRSGDFLNSSIEMKDYLRIAELARSYRYGADKPALAKTLAQLGDEAAAHLAAVLPDALARFTTVVVVTHVPPFREACWHEGRPSDDNWTPHYCCRAVGDVLRQAMLARADRRMLALCGHTHTAARVQVLGNLEVRAGEVVYFRPTINEVFDFPA